MRLVFRAAIRTSERTRNYISIDSFKNKIKHDSLYRTERPSKWSVMSFEWDMATDFQVFTCWWIIVTPSMCQVFCSYIIWLPFGRLGTLRMTYQSKVTLNNIYINKKNVNLNRTERPMSFEWDDLWRHLRVKLFCLLAHYKEPATRYTRFERFVINCGKAPTYMRHQPALSAHARAARYKIQWPVRASAFGSIVRAFWCIRCAPPLWSLKLKSSAKQVHHRT